MHQLTKKAGRRRAATTHLQGAALHLDTASPAAGHAEHTGLPIGQHRQASGLQPCWPMLELHNMARTRLIAGS